MVLNIRKLGLITGVALVIISVGGKCAAYPLSTTDIKRIGSSVHVAMQQVMQIKQEIESNLHIVKEIQNGGYAAAAGDLFAKVQNGDYDRFGNNLKGLKTSTYDATHSAKAVEERKAKEKAEREQKEKEILEANAKAEKEGNAVAAETHKKANKSFFGRAYDWVKNNRTVTNAALDTVDAVKDKDLGSVLEYGSIAGGGAVGGANGSEISALGGIASAGTRIINNSDNLGEVITNTATNGQLSGNLNDLGATHEEYLKQEEERKAKEKEEAEKLAAELKAKMAEEQQKIKQQICNECKAEAENNPNKSCIAACSF